MTEVQCLHGVVYRTPLLAFEALLAEDPNAFRLSISQCGAHARYAHYHLIDDGATRRKVACMTKRKIRTEAHAKRKLKELRRAGRTNLTMYPCWYSYRDMQHWHLGNKGGQQTYYRSGHIFG